MHLHDVWLLDIHSLTPLGCIEIHNAVEKDMRRFHYILSLGFSFPYGYTKRIKTYCDKESLFCLCIDKCKVLGHVDFYLKSYSHTYN